MKRDYSLKGKTLFQQVFNKGYKLQYNGIQIFVLHKEKVKLSEKLVSALRESGIKIGITINKKIGNAVVRNRIKRRIKSICSELIPNSNQSYCVIVRPGKSIITMSYEEQRKNFKELFKRAGLTAG